MKIFTAIILGFLPGIIWLIYFYYKDKRPEPKKLIIILFLLGFIGVVPAAIIELSLEEIFPFLQKEVLPIIIISSFLIVGLAEEIIKFLVLFKKVFKKSVFDEMIDGVIYGVAVGFGFASSENILAIWKLGEDIIIPRSLSATLLHGITAGIIGFYLSVYKFRKRKKRVLLKGLVIAILLHGIYNTMVTSLTSSSFLILILFMILIYFLLFLKIRKAKYLDSSRMVVKESQGK